MSWDLNEAVSYYRSQGAPGDQSSLIALLKEVQQENGGAVPKAVLGIVANGLGVKTSYLEAVIKRIPTLRLADKHLLEVCAGPNCGKAAALAAFAESLQSSKVTVKFVPCMRMCGKGPNIKWDGMLYHQVDTALLKKIVEEE